MKRAGMEKMADRIVNDLTPREVAYLGACVARLDESTAARLLDGLQSGGNPDLAIAKHTKVAPADTGEGSQKTKAKVEHAAERAKAIKA